MIRCGTLNVMPGLAQPTLVRGWSYGRLLRGLFSTDPIRRGMTLVLLGCRALGWNVLISGEANTITGLVMGDRKFLVRFGDIKEKPHGQADR